MQNQKRTPTLQSVYDLLYKAQQDPSILLEQDPRLKFKFCDISQLCNVYLFGSRLYQCHNEESDYDFICLVTGEYFDGSKLFEGEDLNVNIYHWDYFEHLLKENMIWAVMLAYTPSEYIWKETRKLSFTIDLNRLKTSALQDASHNWAKAKRLCTQESLRNIKVSKKNIVHGIRYLNLVLQICKTGSVYDFTAGNDVWRELFDESSKVTFASYKEEWLYYNNKYNQIFQDLMHEVKYFAFVPESLPTVQISSSKHAKRVKPLTNYMASSKKQLRAIEYIQEHGLFSLTRDFSIQVYRPFRKHANIIVCTFDKDSTPLFVCESTVARECSSLILSEEANNHYTIIASGHLPIFNKYTGEGVDSDFMTDLVNIDWKSARICEKIDGFSFIMFKYNGEWLLYSPKVSRTKFKRYFMVHLAQYRRISFESEETLLEHLTEHFWRVWNENGLQFPEDTDDKCFLFELCLNLSTIAVDQEFLRDGHTVQHNADQLYFHGLISIDNLSHSVTELPIRDIAMLYGWKCPHEIVSLQEEALTLELNEREQVIKKYVRSLDPTKSEGIVIVDQFFNRLKYVSPQVQSLIDLQIADLMEPNTNMRNMQTLAKINDHCTFFEYSPWRDQTVLRPLYSTAVREMRKFTDYMQRTYDEIKEASSSTKEFIDNCRKYRFYYVFFDMQKMDESAREFYASTIHRKVLRAIKDMEKPFELIK